MMRQRTSIQLGLLFVSMALGSSACAGSMPLVARPDRGVESGAHRHEGEVCTGALGRRCYATAGELASTRSAEDQRASAAACGAGDFDACNDAGVAYVAGIGAAEEPQLATGMFMKACRGGSPHGCKNVGTQYRFGKAVDPNDPRAAQRYYAMACDEGAASGCYELGEMLRLGIQAEPDTGRAIALHERSCTGGYGEACFRLGYIYGTGANGVRKDQPLGFAKNQRGCDLGNKNACAGVGFQMMKGLGTTKDEAGAFRVLERTCHEGGTLACVTLGRLYVSADSTRRDPGRAAQLFEVACESMSTDGNGSAGCYMLGLMYRDGIQVVKDVGRGTELLHRACDVGGQATACTALGLMHKYGALAPFDLAKAVDLFDRGCKYGDAEGCTNLGAAYLMGEGVPEDRAKAIRLFKYGCDRNVEKACSDLRVFAAPVPRGASPEVRHL